MKTGNQMVPWLSLSGKVFKSFADALVSCNHILYPLCCINRDVTKVKKCREILAPVGSCASRHDTAVFLKTTSCQISFRTLLVCLSFSLARIYHSLNREPPRTCVKIVEKTVTRKGFVACRVKFLGNWPSPKSQFGLKWEGSVNVDLGEG